jgi:hypothetical protein
VAVATGRGVLEVARESFALTLYTWWHLEQRRRLEAVSRKLERFDMAGSMAQAFHEPGKLPDGYHEFMAALRTVDPQLVGETDPVLERKLAVVRAAHAEPAHVTILTPA